MPKSKSELRLQVRQKLSEMDSKQRLEKESELKKYLWQLLEKLKSEQKLTNLGVYYPIALEVDWRLESIDQNFSLSFPVQTKEGMEFKQGRLEDLVSKKEFGVMLKAPRLDSYVVVPEALLIPGLAFDRKLNRLGKGAGYYDRYLAENPNPLKIGIALEDQVLDQLPADPHDVKMNYLITEKGILTGE